MMKKAKRPVAAMLSLLMAVVLVMSGMPIKAEAEEPYYIHVQAVEPAAGQHPEEPVYDCSLPEGATSISNYYSWTQSADGTNWSGMDSTDEFRVGCYYKLEISREIRCTYSSQMEYKFNGVNGDKIYWVGSWYYTHTVRYYYLTENGCVAPSVKDINVQYDEPEIGKEPDFDVEITTQTGGVIEKVDVKWIIESEDGPIYLQPGDKFVKDQEYLLKITIDLSKTGYGFDYNFQPTMNHEEPGSYGRTYSNEWTITLNQRYFVGEVIEIERLDLQYPEPQIGEKISDDVVITCAQSNDYTGYLAYDFSMYRAPLTDDDDWTSVDGDHTVIADSYYIIDGKITLDRSSSLKFTENTEVYLNGEKLDMQVYPGRELYIQYLWEVKEPVVEEVGITIDAPVFGETCAFEASSLTEGVDVSNVFWLAGVSPQIQLQEWHRVTLDEAVEAGYWYAALIDVTSDMAFAPDFKAVINNGSEDVINVMTAINEDDNHEAALAVYWYVVPVMTSGSSYEYTLESGKDVTITCNGNYDDFFTVLVDGNSLEEGDFTVEKGSTIVTIKAETLDKMAVGDHTVAFVYMGGLSEEVVLKIQEAAAEDSGNSSDESSDTNSSSGSESSADESSKDESSKNEGSKGESSDAASSGNESSGNGSSQNGETVKTGDASRPVLYVLITVVSALGILLVSRKKRAELR